MGEGLRITDGENTSYSSYRGMFFGASGGLMTRFSCNFFFFFDRMCMCPRFLLLFFRFNSVFTKPNIYLKFC